jgi:hypothetical protein
MEKEDRSYAGGMKEQEQRREKSGRFKVGGGL